MTDTVQIHASAVALGQSGCLILGPSGVGKSTLALELIALGAGLVADDRVDLRLCENGLAMTAPAAISGLVEARGVGILRLPPVEGAMAVLAVDLGEAEPDRVPPARSRDLLGVAVPVIFGRGRAGLAAIVHAVLCAGGIEDR